MMIISPLKKINRNVDVGTRGNFDNKTDDYENPCLVIKRNYTPKTLNNIYNKGIKIYHNETFIQTIGTEECT